MDLPCMLEISRTVMIQVSCWVWALRLVASTWPVLILKCGIPVCGCFGIYWFEKVLFLVIRLLDGLVHQWLAGYIFYSVHMSGCILLLHKEKSKKESRKGKGMK